MNKKGFVLVETLVVTIFTMFIFTVLYNSVVPLLGKYKELSYYDDLDTTYELYYLKNMIMGDANFSIIKESEYQKISCNDLNNTNCIDLYNFLDIKESDSVLFINTDNLDIIQGDEEISVDIKNYLKYIKTDSENILLLYHDGYLSYIDISSASNRIINVAKNKESNPIIEEDGIIYFSGTNEDIDFNYVWYSGKLWRITAIYPDGTMKMVTDSAITAITWGETATVSDTDLTSAYSTSWVREWLNQEFLPTLYNYKEIIVEDGGWYSVQDRKSIPQKLTGEYTLTDPVGLLNVYEYYMSYKKVSYSNGYLNIGNEWWLITPYDYSEVRIVQATGYINDSNDSSGYSGCAVRPSVYLKSTIQLGEGSGTKNDPYRIKGDLGKASENTILINTRASGEYVKIENDENNHIFRIVDTELVGENLTTKIVLNDYVRDTNDLDNDSDTNEVLAKGFSNSNATILWTSVDKADTTYWRGYLNNTWIKEIDNTYDENSKTSNILEKGTYYLGYHTTKSYKTCVCSSVSSDVSVDECIANGTVGVNSSGDYVGLLRVGEMFSNQFSTGTISLNKYWLITPYDSSNVRYIYDYAGYLNHNLPYYEGVSVRPTINLTDSIVIKSGSGTKQDPFVVGLP